MKINKMTAQHYTDSAFFELEKKRIFSNCWFLAGLVEDIVKPNHYFTVQAGNNNLVIVCDYNQQLRGFHNICRHRGMQLVEGEGAIRQANLTCPYHDWTYNWQGDLKGLPKQNTEFKGLDKSCLSLKAAKVGVWRGMVWVHPNLDATELDDYFAPMNDYLAPYDVMSLIESKDDVVEVEIRANWKLVVENYIDHYHLAQLHAGTLPMYDHKNAQFGFVDDHFHFWQPLKSDYKEGLEQNSYLPLIMSPNEAQLGAFVPMLFPCFGLAESESSWSLFHIQPLAVDLTKVVIRTKVKNVSSFTFMTQAAKSSSYWQNKQKAKFSHLSEDHPLGSGDFMREDVYVCEQMQKSLHSAYFEFGPSAEFGESSIRGFQQRVLNWLET